MENQGKQAAAEGENMSTLRPKCNVPDAPVTYYNCETTENTCQGIPTCQQQTCFGTCYEATCVWYETCGGNTCTATCVDVVCENYIFKGYAKWRYEDVIGSKWWHVGNGIVPYAENGHDTYVQFDDESGWDHLSILRYSDSWYGGNYIRTKTSYGFYIQGTGLMWDTYIWQYYPAVETVHRNGPPLKENRVDFSINVKPWWRP